LLSLQYAIHLIGINTIEGEMMMNIIFQQSRLKNSVHILGLMVVEKVHQFSNYFK